ncbi:MAG: Arc family DNA-binding protein [Thermodesulfobacteriota bacterium]|nr:Arc family DNA-binding protein [Thermodesulfobacteriota bacterium]
MPSVTVKNIPDHAYEILKQVATTNHRSINSEIICLIEKATVSKAFNSEYYLIQAKRSRQKTKQFTLTADILQKAKEEGRP